MKVSKAQPSHCSKIGLPARILNSLFGLRHCGRALARRPWPSAYGQMGRCLSPCVGDLDPNLYRRRLDGALAAFVRGGSAARTAEQGLLDHVYAQMREAAAQQRYERAVLLRATSGVAGSVLFEHQAYWSHRNCTYWISERGVAWSAALGSLRWRFGNAGLPQHLAL